MAEDVARQRGGLSAVIGLFVALAPPTALGAGYGRDVAAHPLVAGGILLLYWLALGTVSLVAGIGGALKGLWAPRAAGAIDLAVTDVLHRRRRHYLRQVRGEVRDAELVGVPTQGEFVLRLEQVYVDVSLVPQPAQEAGHQPFVGRFPTPATERRALNFFLGARERGVFAVLGGPGCGKTTLLRRTALDLCDRKTGGPLPVLVYLRDHVSAILFEPEIDLATIACSAAWLKEKVALYWLRRALDRGRCLVMLDGLDEVAEPTDRGRVMDWVGRQLQAYPGNEYIVTSRPHGYLDRPLARANVLQVRRFTDGQVEQFVHGWYAAVESRARLPEDVDDRVHGLASARADDLIARLRAQPALYDLAANPLLLTMIVTVHKYRGELPGTRAALYAEICDVLLHRRQEAKGLVQAGTGLRGEQKELVMRALAWQMMRRKTSELSETDVGRIMRPVLAEVSTTVHPASFLDEAHRSGLLVERESHVFAFAHLTLQEYLAAAYLRESGGQEQLVAVVEDPWWRECTLLWAAGTDATGVIETCLKSGSIWALTLAFECAEQARQVSPALRQELNAVLESPVDDDPARVRLIAGVKAAKLLGEGIRLSNDVILCARPVSEELYQLFEKQMRAKGRYPFPRPVSGQAGGGSAHPAVGIGPRDTLYFVDWLNSLFNDGSAFRLPEPYETADSAFRLVVDPGCHTAWAKQLGALYCPPGVPHPYEPTSERRNRFPIAGWDGSDEKDLGFLILRRARALALAVLIDPAFDLLLKPEGAGRPKGETLIDLDVILRAAFNQNLLRPFDRESSFMRDLPRVFDRKLTAGGIRMRADLLADALVRAYDHTDFRENNDSADIAPSAMIVSVAKALRLSIMSYYVLIAFWATRSGRLTRGGKNLKYFEEFIRSELLGPGPGEPESLFVGIPAVPSEPALGVAMRHLWDDAAELTNPMVDGSTPFDEGTLRIAVIGLLARKALICLDPTGLRIDEQSRPTNRVLLTMAALAERISGRVAPSEIIVLVRD